MNSEVFRFVTIRPPQQQADASETLNTMVDLSGSSSPFIVSLRYFRNTGSRSNMLNTADEFIGSANFVDSARKLDQLFVGFIDRLQQLQDQNFWDAAREAFTSILGSTPADFVNTDTYTKLYEQTVNSIIAAGIQSSISAKVRSLLVKVARTLWLVRRLAEETPLSRNGFTNAPILLPGGIFPLPVADVDLKNALEEQAKANTAALAARRKRQARLAADLSSYRNTIDELLNAFQESGVQPSGTPKTRRNPAARIAAPVGFLLPDTVAKSLGDATRAIIKKAGISTTHVDVAKTVTLLDSKATKIARQLYTYTGSRGEMVRIGNKFIPRDALAGGFAFIEPDPTETRSPGPCPPVVDTTTPDDIVTVPTGHGDARILGIADLMVLEEQLLRYQLGEIAHIENVLRSEVRSRRFRTRDTTEQTVTTETEITTEKEQDLTSAERFELQTESQTIINQNASKEAGLTIHASYGPSVDATANYNTSSSTSSQQSNTASTNYAREITNKAVERVQTRTLTRRTVTTIKVIEETNQHSFDNKDGAADIVGVYRYVDKIYRAQIINYGKRLMLEFVVPEPAAFLRYALVNKPVDNVTQIEPEPPGCCLSDGKTFVPLQVADITEDYYLYWVSKYGVQDITPPPARVVIATASKKGPEKMDTVPSGGQRKINSDVLDVTIPDGYLCDHAFVNIYGATQAGLHKIVYQLQEQQGEYIEPGDDNILYSVEATPTLTVTINSFGFHNYEVMVTAFCTVSPEKFLDWQLKTFASIMSAYNDLKSAYDQAIREAKLRASDTTVTAPNPLNNAVTMQTELKKGCISLLTGQRFDLFDAVAPNVAPYGYPEIDFAEAKAEGAYISFFEQSFEWNNMVYLFYPYFWGKKADWVTIAQLADNDPLFGQFLRAGAARAQVPVRIGFEEAIITYLSTGELWAGEGTLLDSEGDGPDPLHLSIVAELRSQTGNNTVEGVGTLSVKKNSAAITGSGTVFTTEDENKRIIIGGVTYVIKTVQDSESITLATLYSGESANGLGYAVGGKLVGQPWEVKLPTDLVKLDNSLTFT
jgi:hypothetical protein